MQSITAIHRQGRGKTSLHFNRDGRAERIAGRIKPIRLITILQIVSGCHCAVRRNRPAAAWNAGYSGAAAPTLGGDRKKRMRANNTSQRKQEKNQNTQTNKTQNTNTTTTTHPKQPTPTPTQTPQTHPHKPTPNPHNTTNPTKHTPPSRGPPPPRPLGEPLSHRQRGRDPRSSLRKRLPKSSGSICACYSFPNPGLSPPQR